LLWGAYHFGTDSDGVQQAVKFFETVGETANTLLAVALESNPTGPSMPTRWPMTLTGRSLCS
jgi:lysozyme